MMKIGRFFTFAVILVALMSLSTAHGQAQISPVLKNNNSAANARVNFVIHVQPRLDLTVTEKSMTVNSNTGNLHIGAETHSFTSYNEVIARQVTAKGMVTFASP